MQRGRRCAMTASGRNRRHLRKRGLAAASRMVSITAAISSSIGLVGPSGAALRLRLRLRLALRDPAAISGYTFGVGLNGGGPTAASSGTCLACTRRFRSLSNEQLLPKMSCASPFKIASGRFCALPWAYLSSAPIPTFSSRAQNSQITARCALATSVPRAGRSGPWSSARCSLAVPNKLMKDSFQQFFQLHATRQLSACSLGKKVPATKACKSARRRPAQAATSSERKCRVRSRTILMSRVVMTAPGAAVLRSVRAARRSAARTTSRPARF